MAMANKDYRGADYRLTSISATPQSTINASGRQSPTSINTSYSNAAANVPAPSLSSHAESTIVEFGSGGAQTSSHQSTNNGRNLELHLSKTTRRTRMKQAKEMDLPICLLSHQKFFGSAHFGPNEFNAWYRRDGFQRPVHGYMLIQWVVWGFLALGFFGFMVFYINPLLLRIAVFGVAGGLAGLQFAATIYTMTIDPQDKKVIKANRPRNVEYVKVAGVPVIDTDTNVCGICQVRVDTGTKHCKYNYWSFVSTIVLASILATSFSIFAIWVSTRYFLHRPTYDSVGNAVAAGSVWTLVAFHLRLAILRMTTIELLEAQDAIAYNTISGPAPEISATRKVIKWARNVVQVPKRAKRDTAKSKDHKLSGNSTDVEMTSVPYLTDLKNAGWTARRAKSFSSMAKSEATTEGGMSIAGADDKASFMELMPKKS
ncbi:hypothetical protein BC829DRAFT_386765 [Chytridium lagenaria]|nr:hypothetical protein BC829DRAFT_386765 [Chytridium lagenaria]